MFLYLQYTNKKTIAKDERHQTITGGGISIYFPKTPEVLIKKVANNNSKICFKCAFFKLYRF